MLEALAELENMLKGIADFDYTQMAWPESSREQVMEALRFLLDGSLTLRRKQRGKS